ncbi:MAG: hypothetical protein MUP85_02775 [Candidatus Lokiarchaeota archaeon]|nr:hypothetical protein [Candidatus Lokiarchaeota archaeon]
MSFITGLKELFRKPFYTFIIASFILVWLLILLLNFALWPFLFAITATFGGGLLFFEIIFILISLFQPIEKVKWFISAIIFVISIVIAAFLWGTIFFPTSDIFFIIMLNANLFFTAFFGFKLCMDSATKVDNYVYKGKKSRISLRIVAFISFGILDWWVLHITVNFFTKFLTPLQQAAGSILRIIIWIDLILMGIVVIRLLITKEFAAYITLFFLLTTFYMLYLIFDFIYGRFFNSESTDIFYMIGSFFMDVVLLLYILGTVYDRIEYIKKKLKIFKIDTIALFLITMKLYVQISKLISRVTSEEYVILQQWGIFIIFLFFTFLFGMHSIFTHRYKKIEE